MEKGEKQNALFFTIANHMKKCYLNWNKDQVQDHQIFKQLKEMSEGKIDLMGSEEPLQEDKILLKSKSSFSRKSQQNKQLQRKRKNESKHF